MLVGINLLREGLDLPEVSLVAILDADKEGYLRSATSLIQTAGRAARHLNGEVILYADVKTQSIQKFLAVSEYRRQRQVAYYALQSAKSGRRSVGQSNADVLGTATQLDGRSRVKSLHSPVPMQDVGEADFLDLFESESEDPSCLAARKLDWAAFLATVEALRLLLNACPVL